MNPLFKETGKQALIRARRGQGLFKERVAAIESRCRITGVENPIHLIASHCKPWRDSTNEERLDGEKGLTSYAECRSSFRSWLHRVRRHRNADYFARSAPAFTCTNGHRDPAGRQRGRIHRGTAKISRFSPQQRSSPGIAVKVECSVHRYTDFSSAGLDIPDR